MFCVQESESALTESYMEDKDPLDSGSQSLSSDDEPEPKRTKLSINSGGIDIQVYQIPTYNIPKSLSIYPAPPSNALPKFVNNPLNLANPLTITANGNFNAVKRYSLPARMPMPQYTPSKPVQPPSQRITFDSSGDIVRYKKNGEVAKKRGPPKGYKRKPKAEPMLQNIAKGLLTQAQNIILSGLLGNATACSIPIAGLPPAASPSPYMRRSLPSQLVVTPRYTVPAGNATACSIPITGLAPAPSPSAYMRRSVPSQPVITPRYTVPPGVESVQLQLEPADWFPEEPYRMIFSRKKNPKWKTFPHRCEHCFKGYRVVSTLLQHAGERHGCVPRELAIPCPCCPHVSTRRKQHKKHLETHEGRRHRIFCVYCVPTADPAKPYVKESEQYPFEQFPQYWYASEESLRLHRKRKHPYAAMLCINWFGTWGDSQPNS